MGYRDTFGSCWCSSKEWLRDARRKLLFFWASEREKKVSTMPKGSWICVLKKLASHIPVHSSIKCQIAMYIILQCWNRLSISAVIGKCRKFRTMSRTVDELTISLSIQISPIIASEICQKIARGYLVVRKTPLTRTWLERHEPVWTT